MADLWTAVQALAVHGGIGLGIVLAVVLGTGWVERRQRVRPVPDTLTRHMPGGKAGGGCYMAGPGNRPNRPWVCSPDCPVPR